MYDSEYPPSNGIYSPEQVLQIKRLIEVLDRKWNEVFMEMLLRDYPERE